MEPISIAWTPIYQYKPWYIRKLIICDFGDLPKCITNPGGTVKTVIKGSQGWNHPCLLLAVDRWGKGPAIRCAQWYPFAALGTGTVLAVASLWGDHLYSAASVTNLALTPFTKSSSCAAASSWLAPKWIRSGKRWKSTTSQFSCLHEGSLLSRIWQMNKREKLFRRPFLRILFLVRLW